MTMAKRLLILGASDFQLPAILKAKEMGLIVGVVDINPEAIGVPYADQFYCISTIDEKGVLAAAKDFNADGIVTLCTDMPMRALAYSCEKLGLIGLDYSSAVCSTDKEVMIRTFEKANINHPQFIVFDGVESIAFNAVSFNYPVIVKPTDNSGSRGVLLVENDYELTESVAYSSRNGRSGKVIIEEYLRGPEVSVEIMVINGIPHVLQITDKLTTLAPHFVEIGHSQPSRLPMDVQSNIASLAQNAAKAIGIINGPAHAEIILTESGPKMVEIGARMGGGCITTHLVPLSTGIDMTKATIQIALGEEPDLSKKYEMGSAIRFIIPPTGTVVSIEGEEEAKKIEGIKEVVIQCSIGQHLTALESGASRIGYVIAQASNSEEAVKTCEKALKYIHITVA